MFYSCLALRSFFSCSGLVSTASFSLAVLRFTPLLAYSFTCLDLNSCYSCSSGRSAFLILSCSPRLLLLIWLSLSSSVNKHGTASARGFRVVLFTRLLVYLFPWTWAPVLLNGVRLLCAARLTTREVLIRARWGFGEERRLEELNGMSLLISSCSPRLLLLQSRLLHGSLQHSRLSC